jgi:hypothetical protein
MVQGQPGRVLSDQLTVLATGGLGTVVPEIMVLTIDADAGLPGAFVVKNPGIRGAEREAALAMLDRLPLIMW